MTNKNNNNEEKDNLYNISDFFNNGEGNKKEPNPKEIDESGSTEVDESVSSEEVQESSQVQKKPFNKKILLFVPIVAIFLFLAVSMLSGEDTKTPPPNFNTDDYTSTPSNQLPTESIEVSFNKVEFGEFEETVYEGTKDQFDTFFANDEVTEKYGFYRDSQQTELIIIPLETQYMINLTKVEITSTKEINVHYEFGTPKIPRLAGHVKLFDSNAYSVDFRNQDSGIYKLNMINSDGTVMYFEEFDFTKPFYRSKWDVTSLAWGDKGELVFAGNQDGKWDLWSIDMKEQLEANAEKVTLEGFTPNKIVSRHEEVPLHTLTSLGVENFNIPKPSLNKKLGLLLYHADMDINGVRGDGGNTRVINVGTEVALADGMLYFDYNPKSTSSGHYIYFLRQYDPQTNELWRMDYRGERYEKFYVPASGHIKDFVLSEDEKTVTVILSKVQGDLLNGGDSMLVIPIQDAPDAPDLTKEKGYKHEGMIESYEAELGEFDQISREITTVGYSLQDVDMAIDSKRLVFSMKEHQETSLIRRDLWTVNVNNTELTRLTPADDYMDINPVYSPDGSKIAFLSSKNGSDFRLWTMSSDGSNRMEMDRKIQINSEPLWSEDGMYIYASDIVGNIYEFNYDTGEVVKILNGY